LLNELFILSKHLTHITLYVFELLDGLIEGVKAIEPDCELFQAHRELNPDSGAEEIYMIERLVDHS
jgi:hypothetical protein